MQLPVSAVPIPKEEKCLECNGCGHMCKWCSWPVNECHCDLDLEDMRQCPKCEGSGLRPVWSTPNARA